MDRKLAATELATLLGTLAHPIRIRIIEELRGREMDVTSIQEALGERQSKISQHLSILKSQKYLTERRDGRRIFYQLTDEDLPDWLIEGLNIIHHNIDVNKKIKKAIMKAKKTWEKK